MKTSSDGWRTVCDENRSTRGKPPAIHWIALRGDPESLFGRIGKSHAKRVRKWLMV